MAGTGDLEVDPALLLEGDLAIVQEASDTGAVVKSLATRQQGCPGRWMAPMALLGQLTLGQLEIATQS